MAKIVISSSVPGVFYRRPSPEADEFAKEGDKLEAGTTVAVVEVMKSFQAIVADQTCHFVRYLVEDDEMVMPGDPICELEA
ncbi:MAG: biotin carboxyl carrier domain-containing protein [Rhizobiales bacterium]|nr:biotin carboxyl carrier domain-containing protein [Hyphomicrobiales bacterium]